jgi:hypothetical protein
MDPRFDKTKNPALRGVFFADKELQETLLQQQHIVADCRR